MAGVTRQGVFVEKLSPFLKRKLQELKQQEGEQSSNYRGLYLQYAALPRESEEHVEANRRHWEADVRPESSENRILRGLERLYDRSVVIEPTTICAAHCRYCLRANYDIFTLEENDLKAIAQYCGRGGPGFAPSEVLVTGGDPLIVPRRLDYLVESLIEYAPNIRVVRIGTRLPQQAPERIDDSVYGIFRKYRQDVRFEIGTQINHPVELFPEVREVLQKLRGLGITVYAQNVLLKHVNDDIATLITLYNLLRELDIETHYLFHCVPMKGMHHLRTTVDKSVRLYGELSNGGRISGRAKPMEALMTDIGKITLYEGVILDRNPKSNQVLLQSAYSYDQRMKLNPSWRLPETAEVDEQGRLRVWYLDGSDD